MNLATSQERYSFVNFRGLRVSFPTTHILAIGSYWTGCAGLACLQSRQYTLLFLSEFLNLTLPHFSHFGFPFSWLSHILSSTSRMSLISLFLRRNCHHFVFSNLRYSMGSNCSFILFFISRLMFAPQCDAR